MRAKCFFAVVILLLGWSTVLALVPKLHYPVGARAALLLRSLPVRAELIEQWPKDDELWLHHDARHIIAFEWQPANTTSIQFVLRNLDREFVDYAIYRMGEDHYLVLASRATQVPWPQQRAWLMDFLGNKALLQRIDALHQERVVDIDLTNINRDLPLHLLIKPLTFVPYRYQKPPLLGGSLAWQRLSAAVIAAGPETLLSTAVEELGPDWRHLSAQRQIYVLGLAMLANAMMQQYPSALLLWDKYRPMIHSAMSLDMLLLRHYCLARLNDTLRFSLRRGHAA